MRVLVGKNFARLRKDRGLTQEQVEERSGFSQWYISSLERGRRNPTIISLYELANALGVTVADLIAESGSSDADVSVHSDVSRTAPASPKGTTTKRSPL